MHSSTTSPPSHNNSQHVLAIIGIDNNRDQRCEDSQHEVLEAFGRTSEVPCDIWRSSETPSILLASNYPNCILESSNWCVLCAGFAYRYREAFGASSVANAANDGPNDSFAKTLLNFCERYETNNQASCTLEDCIGKCLKGCSGYFSVYIVHKGISGNNCPPQFWAWNDPFGFMPVYYSHNESSCIISSHWDCLIPNIPSLQLDWDIVAEYITLGTTLGGRGKGSEGGTFDRTFVLGINNLSPGYFLRLMPLCEQLQLILTRYIKCFGACEEILYRVDLNLSSKSNAESSLTRKNISLFPYVNHSDSYIRGVQVVNKSKAPYSYISSSNIDGDVCGLMFQCIMDCVQEAQGCATRAALTGGGDTRLILACMLLLQKHQQTKMVAKNRDSVNDAQSIIFQTHSKQPTDWLIARHLARMFRLKHKRIHPASTTTNGNRTLRRKEEITLRNLHDQTPLRRKENLRFLHRHNTRSAVEYTVHGRFGTEFLGCLCYYKSPLDIRTLEELEKFRPRATALFQAAFGPSSSIIQNPIDTLQDRFRRLECDQMEYDNARQSEPMRLPNNRPVTFDVAYAFQLQIYTRSGLSDIYGGLRSGSWFAIPAAQFTRNAITPFLDNRLLQCMMCSVSVQEKEEPYQLYGRLYQSGVVPEVLLAVPSNNKLLCRHSEIPQAKKRPEARARPHLPVFVTKGNNQRIRSDSRIELAQKSLEQRFHPVFWKGATAIMAIAPIIMDQKSITCDSRPEVQALLDHVGGDAEVACCLSGRLQSFLLWYERRFLVHENKL